MVKLSYLSAIAVVHATPDGLRSQLGQISIGSVADVLADTGIQLNIRRQQLRAGEGLLSTFADIVDGYGCYCNMLGGATTVEKPHGIPADGLDAVCRSYHLAGNCVNIDQTSGGDFCDIQTHEYNSVTVDDPYQYIIFESFDPFTTAVDEDLIVAHCMAANTGDDCAIQACNVDANFVVTVIAYFMESEVLGEIPQSDTTCPEQEIPVRTGGNGPIACCGGDAARFPYLTNGGQRGCCGGKTYDTAILQCCDEATSLIATTC